VQIDKVRAELAEEFLSMNLRRREAFLMIFTRKGQVILIKLPSEHLAWFLQSSFPCDQPL
jgi:uncharacterized protein (DUF3820 family)